MKTIDCVQGTETWLRIRAGLPTASELDNIVSPTGKIRAGEMPKSYLARKLAEKWMGAPIQSFAGGVMEQGKILEGEAIPWLETTIGLDLGRPGFITNDAGDFGSSPDGITLGAGYEIKCAQPENHVKWLLADVCPPDHYLQCQGGCYVTGWEAWYFVAYCRGFPSLMVRVPRNEELMLTIHEAVTAFNADLGRGWETLCEKNGGPPKRRAPRPPAEGDIDPFCVNDTNRAFDFNAGAGHA